MRRIDLIVGLVCMALGTVGILSALSAFSHYSWRLVLGGGEMADKAMIFNNLGPAVPHWFFYLVPLVFLFRRHEAINLLGRLVNVIDAE